ncbi:MAG: BspA family leucine-rich repeat surface protein, partial [Bacilli bacterium]|nr:BspA family leucine-rich repeat surface protein [Bacilli bacterium]
MLKLFIKVKKRLKEKGFTLVELLAVIVILAIIMLISIPAVLDTVQVSRRKTFVSYVDKIGTLATEKWFKDALDGKSSENGCFIYNLKTDFDLSNVGAFKGYVLVNQTGGKPTYYITLWNEDYMLIAYNYTDGINFNNKKISINGSIELFDSSKSNELKPEYLCGFGCESCIVNNDEITPSEVHVPIDQSGEGETVVNPKTQTTLVNGVTFNDIVSKLAGDSNCISSSSDCIKVKEIKKSDVLKENDNVKNISNTDDESQKNPVYVWFENGTIYFYSNADNIYLNSDCYNMFRGFKGLTDVDDFLKNVYSDKVTNMGQMFYECSLLRDLDFSNFNTSKVTNFSDLFSFCESLVTLNITNFNTSR